MAIRSILADPTDFCRRVAQRFLNAFLFTASPVNTALVDSKIGGGDLERLRNAGFVAYRNNQKIWIDLDDPDKDLIKVLPSLGLADPQLAQDDWRSVSEGYYWYRFSWDHIIGGCLIGGMPWIALLIAILMRRRSGVNSLYLVGKPFLVFLPYAVRSDIALLAVSITVIGNAGDTVDSGYHRLIENSATEPIQFCTS